MEKRKPFRRGSRGQKIENYYKVLGVRANATQETIKKKYIEAVKAFPPETHPEKFQQIRRAYETLRDPVRRNEYDLMRKYGDKLENIMGEAFEQAGSGRLEKAAGLFRKALKISPDNFQIYMALAEIALLQEDEESFRENFRIAGELAPEDKKVDILMLKARALLDGDRAEEALSVLESIREMYPEKYELLKNAYIEAYLDLGRYEELWDLLQTMIPAPGSQNSEDVFIFIHLINTMIELEKWSLWSNIQSRTRKFLKSITDPEDRIMVLSALSIECYEYYTVGRFRESEIFIDLMSHVDSKNRQIRDLRERIQKLARVEKEILRMTRDGDVYPLISLYAFEWFYSDIDGVDPEVVSEAREIAEHSSEPAGVDLVFDELIVDSISYMKKKYPLVYKTFQENWEALFKERIAYLNREARRWYSR